MITGKTYQKVYNESMVDLLMRKGAGIVNMEFYSFVDPNDRKKVAYVTQVLIELLSSKIR